MYNVDIELTNRCNADCHFCPRDMTPHQGLMTPEIYAKTLERTLQFQDTLRATVNPEIDLTVNLCGLGEPLINKNAPAMVRQAREAGFSCEISSNASLLDERRGRAVLEAGVQRVSINISDIDEEYEEIYKLPFERTRDNILRFHEMAGDDCEVYIVLVDHRRSRDHIKKMEEYWRGHGINRFMVFDIINRGGALFVDEMQYAAFPETAQARSMLQERGIEPFCAAPFIFLFVGYDGNYYLCCSDWTKEAPLGTVFDESFESVVRRKLDHVVTREPVCKNCNHDPVNRLTDELRSVNAGESDQESLETLITEMGVNSASMRKTLDQIDRIAPPGDSAPIRRRIPVLGS